MTRTEYCQIFLSEDTAPLVEPVLDWLDENVYRVINSETPVVNLDMGYAGTPDLIAMLTNCKITVLDFKTQGTKEGKKINKYDDWLTQLGALYMADDTNITSAKNIVISTTEPGRFEVVDYDLNDIIRGASIFTQLVILYRLINKFEFARVDNDE